eukprot:jgi/Mesvir1/29132/Mv18431-RA.2
MHRLCVEPCTHLCFPTNTILYRQMAASWVVDNDHWHDVITMTMSTWCGMGALGCVQEARWAGTGVRTALRFMLALFGTWVAIVWQKVHLETVEWRVARGDVGLRKYIDEIRAVFRVLPFITALGGALLALDVVGYNTRGLLTLSGIGGVTLSLAAQKVGANMMSGLTLMLSTPFVPGERIRTFSVTGGGSGPLAGRVEKVSLQQTELSTEEGAPMVVPNSVFASVIVQNDSRKQFRRVRELVTIRSVEIPKVLAICSDIEAVLRSVPSHEESFLAQACLHGFTLVGAEILILADVSACEVEVYHKAKGEILARVTEVIQQHGAQLAQLPMHLVPVVQRNALDQAVA